ncbi:MAG: ABC transporter substrate-binding protein [Candidatus Bathyarchaeia archaeon]
MRRKLLVGIFWITVITVSLNVFSIIPAYAFPPINEVYHLIKGTIDGPETVDPARCFDDASAELIFNIYETLLFYDGERVTSDHIMPQLATKWVVENITGSVSPEGLPWFYRYIFEIRTGVYFRDIELHYYPLKPEDVEYTFERVMVYDEGLAWTIYTPLLNASGAEDLIKYGPQFNLSTPEGIINVGKAIDHAVESNATHVWFNFVFPAIYPPFLQILCQPYSSILSKAWINEYVIGWLNRKEWGGEWGDYTDWINYHHLPTSPLDEPYPVMCGTGPFMLDTISEPERYWRVVINYDYWRGWPADFPACFGTKPAGWVTSFTVKWGLTKEEIIQGFLNGSIDIPGISATEFYQKPGVRFMYPLPELAVEAIFYVFDVNPETPYGIIYPPGWWSEDGIPRDFFNYSHIRKGFAYAFDYQRFLQQAYAGEAIAPPTAIVPCLPYYAPVQGYTYNLTKAIEEFQAASVWRTGFTITILYNTGNEPRRIAAEIIKENIEALNPKFHVNIVALPVPEYFRAIKNKWAPLFIFGYTFCYADPHDFASNFYHSKMGMAAYQGYCNPTMDELIEKGVKVKDGLERALIYLNIQLLAVEDCPSVPISQPLRRHWERDWVVDWYYNPVFRGIYAYNLWKWYYVPHALYDITPPQPICHYLPCDTNYDGKVDAKDIGVVGKAFGSTPCPNMHPRWCFRADVNNDRKVDAKDLGFVCKYFGKTSPPWQPPPPPPSSP